MATDHILTLLLIERDKLTAAIEALRGPVATTKAPAKRKISAAGKRAIIAATKKRGAAKGKAS